MLIDKEVFDRIAPLLKPHIKDCCDYCGCKITRDTFGLLDRDITCCQNMICLIEAINDLDKKESSHK